MTTPCDGIINDPKPPDQPSIPDWGGTISNVTSAGGISGATVRLFKCDGGTSTEIDDTTTDSNGDYSFSGFDPGFYYYVKVDMTGPMSGLAPASGTSNPTAALPVGPSQSSVNLGFE